jgi:hypothetical protein
VKEGLFANLGAAWLWLQKEGLAPKFSALPAPKGDEARLQALAWGEDPDPLHQSALDLREGRGAGLLLGLLPERLVLFWQGRLPQAYGLLRLFAEGKREEALKGGQGPPLRDALERTAAHLVLRALEDPRWPASARALKEAFPESPLAWEEASFAAFQEGKGKRPRRPSSRP